VAIKFGVILRQQYEEGYLTTSNLCTLWYYFATRFNANYFNQNMTGIYCACMDVAQIKQYYFIFG
jgi:hypothetical protein